MKPAVLAASAFLLATLPGVLLSGARAQAPPAPPPFPQFQSQNTAQTFLRSAILTSDGVQFWDRRFAGLVNQSIGANFNEIAFAFLQCNGGGMIDELTGLNLATAAYTSAAAHNQMSWARSEDPASGVDPLFNQVRRVESLYGIHYGPAAGGANPRSQRNAAMVGYANDILGPIVGPTTRANVAALNNAGFTETPQYTSTGARGDSIMLHRNSGQNPTANTAYQAILFGGSTTLEFGPALSTNPPPQYINGRLGVNWNTLNRMHDALLAAGYTEAEMIILYPGGEARDAQGRPTGFDPAGNRLPDWIDHGTRARDLETAWGGVGAATNATTQIFYWSSWGHGTAQLDIRAQRDAAQQPIRRGIGFNFNVGSDFTNQLANVFEFYNPGGGSGDPASPYFEVATSVPVMGLQIFLDGRSLSPLSQNLDPFGDGSEQRYKFSLSRTDVQALQQSGVHKLLVDYPSSFGDSADFILQLGPTLGDFANGPSVAVLVPEPATTMLFAVGAVLVGVVAQRKLRRRA